jgi:iron only hydrogenase large subunit-like protein
MFMEEYLMNINIEKCVLCYACVRNCPVKAIAVSTQDNPPIHIINNRCVGCGACYEVCPYDAVEYRSDIEKTKEVFKSKDVVIALLAPSIAGEFLDITDYRKFSKMLHQLGFNKVYEAALGVDLVAEEYKKLFSGSRGKYYLTTNCPVVVSNVEKFQPDLKENLAPIISPWIAMAKVLQKEYGEAAKIIYITPCIAAKEEAKRYNDEVKIASVLTFEELRKMITDSGLEEKNLSYAEFDGPIAYKGFLYPISNGLMQIMDESEELWNSRVITCEGHVDFVNSLQNFNKDVNDFKSHLNIFYCNGCANGPATKKNISKFIKQKKVVEFAKKRHKDFDQKNWERAMNEYKALDLSANFDINDQRIATPSKEEIDKVLNIIGKDHDHSENGCGACGYKNCTEFSIAVSKGLAEPEMCFTYNRRKSMETIIELQKANSKMAETREELEASKKEAMEDKIAMEEAHRITNAMLQELPSALVIVDSKLRVIQANKVLIDLLGNDAKDIADVIPGLVGADLKLLIPYNIQKLFSFVFNSGENIINRDIHLNGEIYTLSLFVIKEGEIAGAVLRNLQQPEIQKEQVIERITEVIDKNLEMVQKIGYLLGEGAAETEQMLNSILQSYKQTGNGDSQSIQINPLDKK